MQLYETLRTQCVTQGEQIAFIEVDTGDHLSFNGLLERVDRCVVRLRALGIAAGDSVVIHLYNSIDAVAVHLAVQYLGAISCFVDALVQPNSLAYYLEKTSARLLLTHLASDRVLLEQGSSTLLHEIRQFMQLDVSERLGEQKTEPYAWSGEETRYVYFTSGTTSMPKGVMLTSDNHRSFQRICREYWQPANEHSRHLCFVPFSHGFGTVFLVPLTLWTGSTLCILRAFHPLKVIEAIEAQRITHLYGVPSHYRQLLRVGQGAASLRHLQMAFCAAAKLEHELSLEWHAATGVELSEGYGLIETCCGIVWRVASPSQGTGHMGPCPDRSLVEVAIFDRENRRLPPGETGEIAVRGPSVMKGYLDDELETRRVMVDGWFRTGDEGHITRDNQLFMTGRIKDVINIAGIKVSPYEVEAVLNGHPDVQLSVVVGVSDPLYGEVVKAFVQTKPGRVVEERDLVRFAAQRLINFQVPKRVEFVERFPLNNMGKLDRVRLRTLGAS